MPQAARWTDKEIERLERRISEIFAEAARDVRTKFETYVERFKAKEKKMREKLEAGEIDKATYRDWLAGQVFQGKRWRAQLNDLRDTLVHSNELAMQMVNDATPEAFAYNANWATFNIEREINADMGFGLYDGETVARLIRDEPTLLPPSRVDIPKDQRWNQTLITTAITQGIIQGEALDDIAKRLQRCAAMNFNQARTHARTAMTGAQNAGRIEGYHRAQEMGVDLEKEWLATLDSHTRHAHAALDGQHVPVDEPFQSELGEIMYPGDPDASPANVYNCRCTLISHVKDYPAQNAKRRPNMQQLGDKDVQKPIKDMTYAEWAGWKKAGLQNNKQRVTMPVSEKENGDVVLRPAGKIVRSMYEKITNSITTDEVIITEERIEHSNLHQNAYDKYKEYMPAVLSDPDFIFRDKRPNTAVLIKEIVNEGNNLQLILRLHVPEDNPEYKNSVISFWDISKQRRENYERNKDIIYKKT